MWHSLKDENKAYRHYVTTYYNINYFSDVSFFIFYIGKTKAEKKVLRSKKKCLGKKKN